MKTKIAAGLSALALSACATAGTGSVVGSMFSVVPEVLQSSFDSWKSSGQTPSSQFSFSNTEAFDGKLYASLDRNTLDADGNLKDVFVKFDEGTEIVPKRNYKWLSVVAAKHQELRKCDVNDSDLESIWLLKLFGIVQDALQVKEVIRYKAIIEYNSAEGDIDGIRYYDANIPTAEKEKRYPEGNCESITLQDLMNTVAANTNG